MVNKEADRIKHALHEEHLRLVYQRGALSISRSAFEGSTEWVEESTRLESIISLVRAIELEPTEVAFVQGVVISKKILFQITSKVALGLFFAAQYTYSFLFVDSFTSNYFASVESSTTFSGNASRLED